MKNLSLNIQHTHTHTHTHTYIYIYILKLVLLPKSSCIKNIQLSAERKVSFDECNF